ncbi:MAG: flippase-like domain-containing protein [Nanoarchaeota archaeon]|nr:flippase-like domain-containing protein [Nanoarchaeota archaeon]MBU1028283.1 flippase-like domain-containing protein [Nanoarchaeota archaeon]
MKIKRFLPLIGILIFIYLLIKLDLSEIIQEIKNANLFLLFIALFFVFLVLITETLKWFVIARKQEIKIPFKDAFKINLITNFYSFITPSKLGTILRVEYLKKYTQNRGRGFSNFVLDKFLDIFSIFFLAIIFSILIGKDLEIIPISLLITIFLTGILLFLLFIKKDRSKPILRIFYIYLVPKKIKERARKAFDSFYEKIPKKREFLLFSVFNMFNWIVIYFVTYIIGVSLGINLPFYYFLAILSIGTIIALIPITINGLGTREATLITLFSLFGLGSAKVFSMSLLTFILYGIIPAIIGSFLSIKNKGWE